MRNDTFFHDTKNTLLLLLTLNHDFSWKDVMDGASYSTESIENWLEGNFG